jgi:hypothetical protein
MNRELKLLLSVSLTALLAVSACTSESDRVYAEAKKCASEISAGGTCGNQQQKKTSEPGNSTPSDNRSTGNENASVYLDSTESMKGFAFTPDTRFTKVIESLSYALPGSRLYKYGIAGKRGEGKRTTAQTQFAREIRFSQELRRPKFYDLAYNEDDMLFNQLADQPEPSLNVLITDGVYSARQSELQSGVVSGIERWVKKGWFFGILIFNSPFEGDLYSENTRSWIKDVKVPARPFYAFVFSPGEKQFRDLHDKLSADFGEIESIVFPHEAVNCVMTPILKQGLEHKDIPPATPYHLHMYNGTLFGEKNSAELAYDVQCLPAKDYAVTGLDLEVSLASYSWISGAFKKGASAPEFDYSYLATPSPTPTPTASVALSPAKAGATPAKPEPRLRVTFRKDSGTGYTMYQLLFTVSAKSLRPTIRPLTTEDDSQPNDADKTYRFFEFISALSTIHLRNPGTVKLPPPAFVVLTNR